MIGQAATRPLGGWRWRSALSLSYASGVRLLAKSAR